MNLILTFQGSVYVIKFEIFERVFIPPHLFPHFLAFFQGKNQKFFKFFLKVSIPSLIFSDIV